MAKMTVAQAIGRFLKNVGTERYYFYNGHANWGLLDAFEYDAKIQGIRTRHECHAIHMADGEWRMRRGLPIPVTCTTTGPGNYNTVAAVAEAYFDSSAMLCLMAGGPTKWYERGGIQELYRKGPEQFCRILEPITKKIVHVIRPDVCLYQLILAYKEAVTGRPGPVVVYLPMDVINTEIDGEIPDAAPWIDILPPAPNPEGISRAIQLIRDAERPFCFVSTGVNNARAWEDLRRFAEATQMPVATSIGSKGALAEDHPLSLGVCDRAGTGQAVYAASQCDLLIGVGTHFNDLNTAGWSFYDIPKKQKLIHIDIDTSELGRIYPTEVAIHADAKEALRALADAWNQGGYPRKNVQPWLGSIADERRKWEAEVKGPLRTSDLVPLHYARIVADASEVINSFDPETALLFDTGMVMNYMSAFLKLNHPYFATCNQQFGQMGFAVPAMVGARLARPAHPVVAFTGDQSFVMTGMSLCTATEYGIPGVVVLLNNKTIQAEVEGANAKFGRTVGDHYRIEATGELWNPDFQLIAKAMRAEIFAVGKPEEFKPALKAALESGKLCVIDVDTDRTQKRYSVPLIAKLGTMPFPYRWNE
jgi:acetolactate synthase I/II/III large subunit